MPMTYIRTGTLITLHFRKSFYIASLQKAITRKQIQQLYKKFIAPGSLLTILNQLTKFKAPVAIIA